MGEDESIIIAIVIGKDLVPQLPRVDLPPGILVTENDCVWGRQNGKELTVGTVGGVDFIHNGQNIVAISTAAGLPGNKGVCQDAGGFFEDDEGGLVLVMADGVGSAHHSELASRGVVRAVVAQGTGDLGENLNVAERALERAKQILPIPSDDPTDYEDDSTRGKLLEGKPYGECLRDMAVERYKRGASTTFHQYRVKDYGWATELEPMWVGDGFVVRIDDQGVAKIFPTEYKLGGPENETTTIGTETERMGDCVRDDIQLIDDEKELGQVTRGTVLIFMTDGWNKLDPTNAENNARVQNRLMEVVHRYRNDVAKLTQEATELLTGLNLGDDFTMLVYVQQ